MGRQMHIFPSVPFSPILAATQLGSSDLTALTVLTAPIQTRSRYLARRSDLLDMVTGSVASSRAKRCSST